MTTMQLKLYNQIDIPEDEFSCIGQEYKLRIYGTSDNPLFPISDLLSIFTDVDQKKVMTLMSDEDYVDGFLDIRSHSTRQILLQESGLYLVLFHTNHPAGKIFRKFITALIKKLRKEQPELLRKVMDNIKSANETIDNLRFSITGYEQYANRWKAKFEHIQHQQQSIMAPREYDEEYVSALHRKYMEKIYIYAITSNEIYDVDCPPDDDEELIYLITDVEQSISNSKRKLVHIEYLPREFVLDNQLLKKGRTTLSAIKEDFQSERLNIMLYSNANHA